MLTEGSTVDRAVLNHSAELSLPVIHGTLGHLCQVEMASASALSLPRAPATYPGAPHGRDCSGKRSATATFPARK